MTVQGVALIELRILGWCAVSLGVIVSLAIWGVAVWIVFMFFAEKPWRRK